jgi:hypothetical protein
MNDLSKIQDIVINTACFHTISLDEMNKVKLMNRLDKKYWFHMRDLQGILDEIIKDYYILSLNGKTELPYSTTYFDTSCKNIYTAHHNGKLNRFKIRKRTYLSSDISFLEVKFKNNKGRTIKERIKAPNQKSITSHRECEFIQGYIPYHVTELQAVLENNFSRIMLVNKNYNERCTIDFNLTFSAGSTSKNIANLTVIEIKSDSNSKSSPLAKALDVYKIKSSGFSKYCIGTVLTDITVKNNAFKPKIRKLEQVLQTKLQVV